MFRRSSARPWLMLGPRHAGKSTLCHAWEAAYPWIEQSWEASAIPSQVAGSVLAVPGDQLQNPEIRTGLKRTLRRLTDKGIPVHFVLTQTDRLLGFQEFIAYLPDVPLVQLAKDPEGSSPALLLQDLVDNLYQASWMLAVREGQAYCPDVTQALLLPYRLMTLLSAVEEMTGMPFLIRSLALTGRQRVAHGTTLAIQALDPSDFWDYWHESSLHAVPAAPKGVRAGLPG